MPEDITTSEVTRWLLEGPAWLRYAVELQLLDGQSDAAPAVRDSDISAIINRLKGSQAGIPAIRAGRVHYTDTGKAYWDLFLLADIGLTVRDTGLEDEVNDLLQLQSPDGSYTLPPNVQDNYFCMSAILFASIARMGYRDDPHIKKYIQAILDSRGRGGGWDCYGDGWSADSCPMDNMNILMLLGQYDNYRHSPALHGAIDALLRHWQTREHSYGFGIGRRFRSLQYPAVKYGILRVLDVLSLFPYAAEQPAFGEMLGLVRGKARDGRYYAEAVAGAYAGLDFARMDEPSRWITFLVNRIEKRISQHL